MAQFPLLKTGAVTQYPSVRELSFGTNVTSFIDGSEQRFREIALPVLRWKVKLHAIDAREMNAIEQFFVSRQGSFGSFEFTDPWTATVYPDCSFESPTLDTQYISNSRAGAQISIRNNQA